MNDKKLKERLLLVRFGVRVIPYKSIPSTPDIDKFDAWEKKELKRAKN